MADSNGPRRPNYGRPEWQQGWDANTTGEDSDDRGIDRWTGQSGRQGRHWERANGDNMHNGWDYGGQSQRWSGRGSQDQNNHWSQGERGNAQDFYGNQVPNYRGDAADSQNPDQASTHWHGRRSNGDSDGNYQGQTRHSDGNYQGAQTPPRSDSYSTENYARYEPPRAQWEDATYRPGTPNFQQDPHSSQQSRPPSFQQVPQRNAIIAGLLGIFLGAFGAHNFYTGRYKIAIVQLALTVLSSFGLAFITGLWGIIEGLMYLLASTPYYEQDGWGRPLSR